MERARLEELERQVEAAQASYNERMEKGNASLAERQKKMEADNEHEVAVRLEVIREDYRKNLETQETRFKKKVAALEKKLRESEANLKEEEDAKSRADKAVAAS